MSTIKEFTAGALCALLLCVGTGCQEKSISQPTKTPEVKIISEAEKMVEKMSLRQQIGQMLMPAFQNWEGQPVTEINEEISAAVGEYGFGGIILFSENFDTPEKTRALTQGFQHAAAEKGHVPLFIGVDQEGGEIVRLSEGTGLPGNMALGASTNQQDSYTAGIILGTELDALGINVNFAPDMDINSNPENPVIGTRSFSGNPDMVASRGCKLMEGMRTKVASAVKHFPGHGDTAVDSHYGLPRVDKSYEEIKGFELKPFQAAIDAGTDFVMLAHIQYPKIETEQAVSVKDGEKIYLPATLSKTMVTDVLRKDMGFKGLVITDAMNMSGLSQNFERKDIARRAINAGVNILLMPVNIQNAEDIVAMGTYIDEIEAMAERGEIAKETLRQSAQRIVELKLERGLVDKKSMGELSVLGSEEHRNLEREMTRRAITVTQNNENTLPLKMNAGQKVLFLGAYENELPSLQYGFTRLQAEGMIDAAVSCEVLDYTGEDGIKDSEKMAVVLESVGKADAVVIISELSSPGQLNPEHWRTGAVDDVLRAALEENIPTVVLSVGQPYDVARYPEAGGVVAAYNSNGMELGEDGKPKGLFGPNIPTAMDIIFGACEPKGVLPVDVMRIGEDYTYTDEILYKQGFGLTEFN